MANWTPYLTKIVHRLERGVDRAKLKLDRRFGRENLVALPYLGFGTRERFYLKGRVLEDQGLGPADPDASLWRNFKDALRRFESDEIPGAVVEVRSGGSSTRAVADEEGFFEVWLERSAPLPPDHPYLQEVTVELIEPRPAHQRDFLFEGMVVVPPSGARFGIISDMDDTVLQTGATSLLSMAKKTLFGNSRTRLPFEGVAGFYQALHAERNPIFYLSSSPWNLYDVLTEFLELNDVPLGPLTLRDWGVSATELLPTSHGEHKHEMIERLLSTYPTLPFILIGDSGQEDPEIYREVVHRHPDQILAIYIRDVTPDSGRSDEIAALARELDEAHAPLVLVADTVAAAEHAAARGWIAEEDVALVREAKAEDEVSEAL